MNNYLLEDQVKYLQNQFDLLFNSGLNEQIKGMQVTLDILGIEIEGITDIIVNFDQQDFHSSEDFYQFVDEIRK